MSANSNTFNKERLRGKGNLSAVIQHVVIVSAILAFSFWFDPRPEFIKKTLAVSDPYFFAKTIFLSVVVFYLNFFVLVPNVLTKKGWLSYLIIVVVVGFIFLLIMRFVFSPSTDFTRHSAPPVFLFLLIITLSLSTSIRLTNDKKKEEQLRKEKEMESISSELSLLRSQISPHFMFNVLNTLASLARQKSDQLELVIIRVSQLMRYMLYNKPDKKISLRDELEYLISYIELQQLRFGTDFQFKKLIQLDRPDMRIEPMLLIPFIENAFKHGVNSTIHPLIELNLTSMAESLHFVIKNRFDPTVVSSNGTSGIGLQNVKKRLLLLYKDRHEMKIYNREDMFIVELTILLEP